MSNEERGETRTAELIKEAQRASCLVESDAVEWMPDPRARMQMNLVAVTDRLVVEVQALRESLSESQERGRHMVEALRVLRAWADALPKSDELSSVTTEGEKAVALIDEVLGVSREGGKR